MGSRKLPAMSAAIPGYLLVVLVVLGLVLLPVDAQDGGDGGDDDLVPYGALSASVQARLQNAALEQPLEPYGALSPSIQSRLIRGGDTSCPVLARLRLL